MFDKHQRSAISLLCKSNHHFILTVSYSLCKGFCTEACKHHIVGSTDPGTGQHGRHSQRTGGHVDGDAVPLLYAVPPQQVPQAASHLQQLPAEIRFNHTVKNRGDKSSLF